MEEIREALDRAKARDAASGDLRARDRQGQRLANTNGLSPALNAAIQESVLNNVHLQANRIITHDHADGRSTPYDILRTQVLQSMDQKKWKFLGVTSPTPGCGKTVTAINLALSIARQPHRSALLVDLDLRRPSVAKYLGLKSEDGVVGVVENRSRLVDAMIQARVGEHRMLVLPTHVPASNPSDRMASRAMGEMFQRIKAEFPAEIVILDLPPVLSCDDVLSVSPQLDCVLLIAAAGVTTTTEINEASKHLHSTQIIRVVLNKVSQSSSAYLYY
jgi:protein-tyrosine kinase